MGRILIGAAAVLFFLEAAGWTHFPNQFLWGMTLLAAGMVIGGWWPTITWNKPQ